MTACLDSGWRAVFAEPTGAPGSYTTEPVACWLLVRHDNGDRHVHPAVVMGTIIEDATFADNYLGVVAPGQEPKTLIKLASVA